MTFQKTNKTESSSGDEWVKLREEYRYDPGPNYASWLVGILVIMMVIGIIIGRLVK